MRRENRRKPLEEGLDTKKMLYITGSVLALAVIVFVITFLMYSNKLNSGTSLSRLDTNTIGNVPSVEETSTSYGKTINEMKNETSSNTQSINETNEKLNVQNNNIANNNINTNTTNSKKNTATNTTSSKVAVNTSSSEKPKQNTESAQKNNETTTTKKVEDPEFKKPVNGDILKEFADNKLVYSSTLDVWSTHNGIDILAEKMSVVKASADGKITSIKNDPRYGLTITIEHVNGYKTIYANLLSTEFVVEGENVKQGQSIGTIGNSASFEISDESHLHFELLKDNEQQDPELYLK